jgi:hypothetical protein
MRKHVWSVYLVTATPKPCIYAASESHPYFGTLRIAYRKYAKHPVKQDGSNNYHKDRQYHVKDTFILLDEDHFSKFH